MDVCEIVSMTEQIGVETYLRKVLFRCYLLKNVENI